MIIPGLLHTGPAAPPPHNIHQASATAYSIAETAKANNLKPYEYFRYLLTELAERVDTKMDARFTLEDLI